MLNMATTFTDLGIRFPLFEAPVREASEYRGAGTCTLCLREADHCFEPSDVALACPTCGSEGWLWADGRGGVCRRCGGRQSLPDGSAVPALCCYPCLRVGRAAITKDTVLGM